MLTSLNSLRLRLPPPKFVQQHIKQRTHGCSRTAEKILTLSLRTISSLEILSEISLTPGG